MCRHGAWVADGEYRAGAVDLLGILAYGALTAFERLAEDAGKAPTLADKVRGASSRRAQIDHFERVRDRLAELDVDVMAAMQPFHQPFDTYHATPGRRTGSRAWSRRTSGTGSRPTSTARSRPSSTPTPATWCTRCWPTRA